MAVIYLKHPVHGCKVESNEMIAALDRAAGWVEYDPTAPKVAPEPVVAAPVAPTVPSFLKAEPKKK